MFREQQSYNKGCVGDNDNEMGNNNEKAEENLPGEERTFIHQINEEEAVLRLELVDRTLTGILGQVKRKGI